MWNPSHQMFILITEPTLMFLGQVCGCIPVDSLCSFSGWNCNQRNACTAEVSFCSYWYSRSPRSCRRNVCWRYFTWIVTIKGMKKTTYRIYNWSNAIKCSSSFFFWLRVGRVADIWNWQPPSEFLNFVGCQRQICSKSATIENYTW